MMACKLRRTPLSPEAMFKRFPYEIFSSQGSLVRAACGTRFSDSDLYSREENENGGELRWKN